MPSPDQVLRTGAQLSHSVFVAAYRVLAALHPLVAVRFFIRPRQL